MTDQADRKSDSPGGMMRTMAIIPVALIILLTLCSPVAAGDVNTVLDIAKREGKAVMLELGSVGCGPCEQMKAVMEKLKTTYGGRLEVVFVDVRKDRDVARKFGVYVIPTQVFLDKNGKEFHRHLGFYGYEEIVPLLKKAGM